MISGFVFCACFLLIMSTSLSRDFGLFLILCILCLEVWNVALGVVRACGLLYVILGVCGWWYVIDPYVIAGIVWASDVGGYLWGRSGRLVGEWGLGRSFPRLSPGKTYIGYFGSACTGRVVAYCFEMIGCSPTLPWYLIVFAACLGDLIGSAIKRHAGVQDYSQLIPGHGGLMDRWDSLLLVGIINLLLVDVNRVL